MVFVVSSMGESTRGGYSPAFRQKGKYPILMPVTPTSNPDVFRVSFTVAETGTGQYTGRHQAEIVCLLRLVPTGMEILYVHHLFRSRSGALGAFEEETPRRLDLTHSLIATIQSGVKEEFWSAFVKIGRASCRERV